MEEAWDPRRERGLSRGWTGPASGLALLPWDGEETGESWVGRALERVLEGIFIDGACLVRGVLSGQARERRLYK